MPASCSGSTTYKLKKKHTTGSSKVSRRRYPVPDPPDRDFETRLGYCFKDKELLREALTHSSFCHEHPDVTQAHNERLEFLGDSVLGFIVVEYIFLYEGHLSEAVMAKTKSYIVKEAVLSDIAASLSLGKYLRLGKGEESSGGRLKKSLLADAVEAIIGAVYLDTGFEKTKEIVNLWTQIMDGIAISDDLDVVAAILTTGRIMEVKLTVEGYSAIKENFESIKRVLEKEASAKEITQKEITAAIITSANVESSKKVEKIGDIVDSWLSICDLITVEDQMDYISYILSTGRIRDMDAKVLLGPDSLEDMKNQMKEELGKVSG